MRCLRAFLPLFFLSIFLTTTVYGRGEIDPFKIPFDTVSGKKLTLSSLQGKVFLLNFWATWCPPCKEEIPDLIALQKRYRNRGFVVVGINYMDRVKPAYLKKFASFLGINYPLIYGDYGRLNLLAQSLGGVRGLPVSVLINHKGEVAEKYTGALNVTQFSAIVEPLLDARDRARAHKAEKTAITVASKD
ncbi:TlpA family protein disulfide reductase [Magnetococcales bacterium HHB-1]